MGIVWTLTYLLTFFRVIAFRQQCEYVSDVVLRGTFCTSEANMK